MQSRHLFTLKALIISAILLAANTAFAGDTGSVATMDEPTHIMSLTFSPSHLFTPVFEFTAEFKAHENWSFALIGGGGTTTVESEIMGDPTVSVWEAGGQLRYYVFGDFDHGMQIGAEILYINLSNDKIETSHGNMSGLAHGLNAGPFLGYKIATKIAFTFDAQLGFGHRFAKDEQGHAESGTNAEADFSDWGPFLNLNIGWSF